MLSATTILARIRADVIVGFSHSAGEHAGDRLLLMPRGEKRKTASVDQRDWSPEMKSYTLSSQSAV